MSHGGIKEPEALNPGEYVGRLTASTSYASSRLSVTGAYARKDLKPGPVLDAWLIEANWKAAERHNVFARAERVENNELFDHHSPLHDVPLTVSKLSLGYAWPLPLGGEWHLARPEERRVGKGCVSPCRYRWLQDH